MSADAAHELKARSLRARLAWRRSLRAPGGGHCGDVSFALDVGAVASVHLR
jgi:hypothetical protein